MSKYKITELTTGNVIKRFKAENIQFEEGGVFLVHVDESNAWWWAFTLPKDAVLEEDID